MLQDPDFGTIYCVIDGLDECDEGSLKVLLIKLSDFFLASSSRSTVGEFKLIVVSRELPKLITAKLSCFLQLKLDPDSDDKVNNDIKQFISIKVNELSDRRFQQQCLRIYRKRSAKTCRRHIFVGGLRYKRVVAK